MTAVHLAQIAAVQGPVLFLWDLDRQISTSTSLSLAAGIETHRGQLVWLSYDGPRPIAVDRASEADLTPERRAVMLAAVPDADGKARHDLIWGDV